MNIFPTRYSTFSAQALAKFIQEQYGFSGVRCQYKMRGVSDTYEIWTDTGSYILKIFRPMHRTTEELQGELAFLQYLLEKNIRIAAPVKDLGGNALQSFQAIEGIRHGILYNYAPGRPIIDQTDAEIIGSAQYLATFHQQTEGLTIPYNRQEYTLQSMLHDPLQAIRPAYEQFGLTEEYAKLEQAAGECLKAFEQLDIAQFSKGYCHYDYMPKNWHHDEDGNMTLFDFDFAGDGWLMNDIASYAVYVTLLTSDSDEGKRRLKLFMDEYSKLRPIHPEELKALPHLGLLFILFYLKYQYENFEDHTNFYFGPRFLRERSRLILSYQGLTQSSI